MLLTCPTPAKVFQTATKSSRFAHFWEGADSLALAMQNHILTSKSVPRPPVFYTFDLTCASRRKGVHFFIISASKSAPSMVCFVHFHFKMCFAPQGRALFQHLNFQKWTETFSSTCALRRNGVRFFNISISKNALTWCVLHILTSKYASCTTACNFSSLIWPDGSAPAALASLLFDPPGPQIIGKTQ